MAKRKKRSTAREAMARAWARTAGGNVKAMFTITPEQERALRQEALKRMAAVGSARPDASAVLREVLDGWIAKRR